MITDKLPVGAARRREYDKSDALMALPLPENSAVVPLTRALIEAIAGGDPKPVTSAARALLEALGSFYTVPTPSLRVLGVRPHQVTAGVCTYQLFGDYTLSTQRIRVWLRTAMRGKVSSPKAFLNTLLHEFCHHLDATHFDWPHSFHTRGFYTRIDRLYHHALATPPEGRRPLYWIPRGGVWTVDWRKLAARRPTLTPADREEPG